MFKKKVTAVRVPGISISCCPWQPRDIVTLTRIPSIKTDKQLNSISNTRFYKSGGFS